MPARCMPTVVRRGKMSYLPFVSTESDRKTNIISAHLTKPDKTTDWGGLDVLQRKFNFSVCFPLRRESSEGLLSVSPRRLAIAREEKIPRPSERLE
jgi:hypothetical protein